MSNIKRNIGLQSLYQILSACMPLITAPYLARKLGSAQLGVFSFTSSIVVYFTIVAMLGTVNYGTRCIAAAKDDKQKRNEAFTSIFILQILVSSLCLMAYGCYLVFFCYENKTIAIIQGIALLSCFCDINWLFWGVEDFKITVSRSIVIKIITVALILLLVKQQSDLWVYALILNGGTLVSNIVLLFYCSRYVSLTKVSWSQIKEHIIPNLILFVPILAMSVYHTMDKTMLGALSTYEQSGFYYNSDKIVQTPLLVIYGIGTVMLPRMSSLLADKKQKEADDLFMTTLNGVAASSIAIACGIAAISKEFIPIFFGKGFDECIVITIVFTPILLAKGFSVIIRTQYLVPMKMENEFIKSVVFGAVINLIFNFVLIPSYGALGAAIATVIAEFAACILQFLSIRDKRLGIRKLFVQTVQYIGIGLLMILVVRITALLQLNIIVKLVLEIVIGAVFFCSITIIFWIKTKNKFYEIFVKQIIKRNKPVNLNSD